MLELTPESRKILSERIDLLELLEENQSCPSFPNVVPNETEVYVGGGFLPTFRFRGDELVEYNEPEYEFDVLLIYADDHLAFLRVADQVLLDYSEKITFPEFSLKNYQDELIQAGQDLDKWIAHIAELNRVIQEQSEQNAQTFAPAGV